MAATAQSFADFVLPASAYRWPGHGKTAQCSAFAAYCAEKHGATVFLRCRQTIRCDFTWHQRQSHAPSIISKSNIGFRRFRKTGSKHAMVYDLFPEQEQAIWCFEMRDRINPAVRLGSELQLYIVELPKSDRLLSVGKQSAPSADGLSALSAWIKYFQHWKEPRIMDQIAYPPVRQAMRKLKALSADDETRRLAEVRERALMTERTEIKAAEERGKEIGKQEGAEETWAKAIKALIQSGMSEIQARTLLGLTNLPNT